MKRQSLLRFVLVLIATIEVTSARPTKGIELDHRDVWQDVGVRSFYGPWDISVKRNGDYIDYNDYDARIEQFRPDLSELSYDGASITNGYINAVPPVYDSDLPKLNRLLSSVGLADFRTGIRTDWFDQSTDSSKGRYWDDIAYHKIDEDTKNPYDSATPIVGQ